MPDAKNPNAALQAPGTMGVPPALTAKFVPPPQGNQKAPAVVTAQAASDHVDTMSNSTNTALSDAQIVAAYRAAQAQQAAQVAGAGKDTAPDTGDNTSSADSIISSMFGGDSDNQQQQIASQDEDQIAADQQLQSQVNDDLTSMEAGSFPLTQAEQLQVSAVRDQFTGAIKVATDYAKNMERGATALVAKDGLQMYSPRMAIGEIRNAITAGQAKVEQVNTDVASSMAKLTTALQDGDYKTATRLYDKIGADIKTRTDEIDKINTKIGDTQKTLLDANLKANESYTKTLTDIYKSLGPDTPKQVYDAIATSPNVSAAMQTAAPYMTGNATGDVGAYQFYSRQAKAAGQTPLDFLAFLKAKAEATAKPASSNNAPATSGATIGATTLKVVPSGVTEVNALNGQGIIDGTQPPTVSNSLSGNGFQVKAYLAANGYDLTKAFQDWTATQKLLQTMNGATQTRLRQAIGQVDESLNLAQSLSDQWAGGGFPALNRASLLLAKGGAYGSEAQSIATQLEAEINDITSELGTVYKGGNSSTDESLKLAATQLSSDWSQKTFQDMIRLAKQNIQYRKNSLTLSTAGITDSSYNPQQDTVTSQSLVNDEASAQNSVREFYQSNPDAQDQIDQMISDNVPYLQIEKWINGTP